MKRLVFSILFVALAIVANAWDCPPAEFDGVPLRQDVFQFSSALKKKGYYVEKIMSTGALIVGQFAGIKVSVVVNTNSDGLVNNLMIFYEPKILSWNFLKHSYFKMKERLTQQMGEPVISIESFNKGFTEEYALQAMAEDCCNYKSRFQKGSGTAALDIIVLKRPVVALFVNDYPNECDNDIWASEKE